MERLEAIFKILPREDHKESTYRAITYLLCVLPDTEAIPERHSYKGRSDLEVLTHYGKDDRKVYLIGANYIEDKDERKLEYRFEEMKK